MHRKWQMFRTRLGKGTILSFCMNTCGKEKLQKNVKTRVEPPTRTLKITTFFLWLFIA